MTSSGVTKPDDSVGVIPAILRHDWRWNMTTAAPTGGIYTSSNDLSAFLCDISDSHLSNTWLKPASYASSPPTFYSMPWEMTRHPVPGPLGAGSMLDIYSKGGALFGYYSGIHLVPDYGVGVTILTAGDPVAIGGLSGVILSYATTALIGAAKKEAGKYAGNYVAEGLDSSLRLVAKGGLHINAWRSNGTDFPQTLEFTGGGTKLEFHIYPTGFSNRRKFYPHPAFPVVVPETACITAFDGWNYGAKPLDEFEFEFGDDGPIAAVLPALRVRLVKENKRWGRFRFRAQGSGSG